MSAASNLQQAVGGVQSVFKDNAATILDWGKNNAANFGLSQRAFNEMAGPLGAMLKNTGMDMSAVSGKTIDLTKRAADMAATFGGDATEALTAISAALRGETDPIERYGVSMNAAKVEARAMADTGKTVASTLTDQEKAAARLAILFEQTADAEGQSAREADSHAGATARATAKMEDMQAQIGAKLLPITVKLTEVKLALINAIVTKVIPALEELYARHWPAVQKVIDDVIRFVQDNWPLFSAVISFGVDYVVTKVEGLIQIVSSLVEIVSSVINLVSALVHGDWSRAWNELKDIAQAAVSLLEGWLEWTFGNLPRLVWELAGKLADAGWEAGKRLADSVVEGIGNLAGRVADKLSVAGVSLGDVIDAGGGIFNKVTGRAAGGPASGLTWVGERGPELLSLPPGSHVYSNAQSMAMTRGGPTVNINILGPVYGMDDLNRKVAQAWMEAYRGGAFYGVSLAGAR